MARSSPNHRSPTWTKMGQVLFSAVGIAYAVWEILQLWRHLRGHWDRR